MPKAASGVRVDYALTAHDRHDARQAKILLREAGLEISLTEAARAAIAARAAPARLSSTPLDVAIDGFLRRALEMKLREETYDFYERKLAQLARRFPGETLDAVTRPRLHAWLESLEVSPVTRRGTLRAVHALYSWARSKEPPLCAVNSCEGLRIEEPRTDKTPTILHAADVQALLEGAGPYRAAVALMVFAGVRPDELAGEHKAPLPWSMVDAKKRRVTIPIEQSKTRSPRVIEKMPHSLWAWLGDVPATGPISPARSRQIIRRCWSVLRKRRPDLKKWPVDVLRHTAASYLLALWGDAGRVSRALGWEGKTEVLFARYAATGMTKAQAEAIAALRPPEATDAPTSPAG